jgi:phage terminase small subunit
MPRRRRPRNLITDGRVNRRFLDELRSTRTTPTIEQKLENLRQDVLPSQVEQIEGIDPLDDEQLSPLEAAFVREYQRDKNATRAVIAAGYQTTVENAAAIGWRLLRKRHVATAIRKRDLHLRGQVEITLQDLVLILAPLCTGNLADMTKIGENGEPYFDLQELDREQFAAIQELTVEDFLEGRGENAREVRRVKVRLADRIAATRTLAEILGILRKRVEVEDVTPQPIPQEVVKRLSDDQLRRLVAIGEKAKREQRAILGEIGEDDGVTRPME